MIVLDVDWNEGCVTKTPAVAPPGTAGPFSRVNRIDALSAFVIAAGVIREAVRRSVSDTASTLSIVQPPLHVESITNGRPKALQNASLRGSLRSKQDPSRKRGVNSIN